MNTPTRKPFGGVIAAPGQHAQAVITLLSHHVRGRFEIAYYAHANEIDHVQQHDFFVVFSVGDLEAVAHHYGADGQQKPVIVHVDEPKMLAQVDHAAFFPDLDVISIEQADLTAQPDITLRLDVFRRVIEALEARI
ncbi:MAG: hypothetical protein GX613_05650 [Chloroflexi bacterium]|nr:hypothetical protein [Chloroflexota bacterium]